MAVRGLVQLFLVSIITWQVVSATVKFGQENGTRKEGQPFCSFNCLPRNRTQFLGMGETGILWEGEDHRPSVSPEDSWTCWTELRTCHACRIEITWREIAVTESETLSCTAGSSRLDRLIIYEPGYNISTEVTPSSSSSLSSSSSSLFSSSSFSFSLSTTDQSPDDDPSKKTYSSLSSLVVLRAEVTSHASPIRASHLVITYAVKEARETYRGVDRYQMSLRSPNYPLGYAMMGDSIVYSVRHVDRHSLIAIVFDDWMLSTTSCIDFCRSVELTDCHGEMKHSCGSDDRPTLVTKGAVSLRFTTPDDVGHSTQPPPDRHTHPPVGFHATIYFRGPSENLDDCRLPSTDCGSASQFHSVDREGSVEFTQPERLNDSDPQFFDCVWVLSAAPPHSRLEMKIVNMSIASDLFTVSVHDGLASTSPAVATFWGSIETDVASTICGRPQTVGDRRRTVGPRGPHGRLMNVTNGTHDDWSFTPMGNATIVVSRFLYVRLRGLFHSGDSFSFLYRLYHRPSQANSPADKGNLQMNQTIASQEVASRMTSLPSTVAPPLHDAGNVVCCSEAVCVDRRFVCRTPSCMGQWNHWSCPESGGDTQDPEVASSSSSSYSSSFPSFSAPFSSSLATAYTDDGWTLFVPIGFAVCLFWIAVLWFVVRMRKIQLPVRRQRAPCRRSCRVTRRHGTDCRESCTAYCICSEVPVYYSDISRSISTVTTSASFSTTVYGLGAPNPPPPSYEEAVKGATGHPILTVV